MCVSERERLCEGVCVFQVVSGKDFMRRIYCIMHEEQMYNVYFIYVERERERGRERGRAESVNYFHL